MINLAGSKSSIQVNPDVVEHFISDPNFPYLISFPRTGSHWLRMMMELYFGIPSLVRIFYYHETQDFTCYHRHDDDLNIARTNVLYLYRYPVDTIYSQLNYWKEDFLDFNRVKYWTERYARHLSKWLVEENFTVKKTILTYEGIKTNPATEFNKVCDHLGMVFNLEKFDSVSGVVTRQEVHKRTLHDPQVINLSHNYYQIKKVFKNKYTDRIMDIIYAVNPELKSFFHESE